MQKKPATTSQPINELLANRWSPRAIDPNKAVSKESVISLLEAARWAPSCANEQPWRYVVFTQDNPEALEKARSCLVPGNAWAKNAPVLFISVTHSQWNRDGSPNPYAEHDLGMADENLMLEASSLGLVVHSMAGFDAAKARELFHIPEGYKPMAMIAVGHYGPVDALSDKQKEGEIGPRSRQPLEKMAFFGDWSK